MNYVGQYFKKYLLLNWQDRSTLIARVLLPLTLLLIAIYISISIAMGISQSPANSKIAIVDNNQQSPIIHSLSTLKNTQSIAADNETEIKDLITKGAITVGIIIPHNFDETVKDNRTATIEVFYNSKISNGLELTVLRTIKRHEERLLDNRLQSLNITSQYIDPIEIVEQDQFNKIAQIPIVVSSIVPFLVLLFSFLTCIYPSLNANPQTIKNHGIRALAGHMLTIMFFAILTTILTLYGLYVIVKIHPTLSPLIKNLVSVMFKWKSLALLLLSLLPFLFFMGSWLTWIGLAAGSYKRAQNIIQPFKLVFLSLLGLIFLPTVLLEGFWQSLPVTSTGLLIRSIFMDDFTILKFIITSIPLVIFGTIGLYLSYKTSSK